MRCEVIDCSATAVATVIQVRGQASPCVEHAACRSCAIDARKHGCRVVEMHDDSIMWDADPDRAIGLTGPWPKACGCGRSYTEHEWSLLKYIGEMVDPEESCELRNCACGSTIAVAIDMAHADTERPGYTTVAVGREACRFCEKIVDVVNGKFVTHNTWGTTDECRGSGMR